MTFVMLNPGTADATQDDPTTKRCIYLAARAKCERMQVVSLFTARATRPRDLARTDDPVGPEADIYIAAALGCMVPQDIAVAAWGVFPKAMPPAFRALHASRVNFIIETARRYGRPLHAFGFTAKEGAPRHPIYVSKAEPLVGFSHA